MGVVLRRAWFGDLLGAPQSLCVLEVDRRAAGVGLLVGVPPRLTRTSEQAAGAGVLAAVNGGFFLPQGLPRGLRRCGGREVAPPTAALHACVGWNEQRVRFGDNHDGWSDWPEVVEAGPRLVAGGSVVDHGAQQRTIRHPRTALGVRADGLLLLLTADGRTPTAGGLALHELGQILQALGCVDAINLDGGGSTTLWAAGFRGGDGSCIANHPCDDKRFDAAGERAVADVLLVQAQAVVQLDEADAAAHLGELQAGADGSGYLGGGFLFAPAGERVRVGFAGVAPRTGRYEVQRRSVVAAGFAGAEASFRGAGGQSDPAAAGGGLPADAGDTWLRVGEVFAEAGAALGVEACSVPGRPFVVDAVRFVEQPR